MKRDCGNERRRRERRMVSENERRMVGESERRNRRRDGERRRGSR